MNWPRKYATVKIESTKHDGSLHRRWETNRLLFVDSHKMIGMNDRTMVTDHAGSVSQTIKPTLFYFDCLLGFNIVYIMDGRKGFYYCNISSPCRFHNQTIHYIDYDIDFIVKQDFSYKIVDLDEYEVNKKKYHYPIETQRQVNEAVTELENRIIQREIPFQKGFVESLLLQFRSK